jgi:hypothetical protein
MLFGFRRIAPLQSSPSKAKAPLVNNRNNDAATFLKHGGATDNCQY